MRRVNLYLLLSVLLFQIPLLSKADAILEGSIVYFDNSQLASSSSRPAQSDHWIGEVKKVLKSGLVEILPSSLNGFSYSGPRVFRHLTALSPKVSEYRGFSAGNFVTTRESVGRESGSIVQIFSNGLAQVDWSDHFPQKGAPVPNILSVDRIILSDSVHPSGLRIGQTVFFQKEVAINLSTSENGSIVRESKYPTLKLDLGHLAYVGRIAEIEAVASRSQGPESYSVKVTIEKENGLDQKNSQSITINAKELSPELVSNPDLQFGSKGDSVAYSSDRGIKPYKFQGTVKRVFENGILEIQWGTKNDKQYRKANLDYLPAQALKPSFTANLGQGISVSEGDGTSYLALASVERALRGNQTSTIFTL